MIDRWQNQEEAVQFALSRPASMLDMEMGTGKTRVAIDVAFARKDAYRILVVCPKAVIGVWRENLEKFAPDSYWRCWDVRKGSIASKVEDLKKFMKVPCSKQFVVINYDSVWRKELGDFIYKKAGFHMVILDESHRAKSAGSKVSKFLGMLGKKVKYKMCLSGTPMANSPLDVYGQYRFLDPSIYGTNHSMFLQRYAIMGGPDYKFIVGFKNLKDLNNRFNLLAYHCRMSDISDRLKLPNSLPPTHRNIQLPSKDMKTIMELNKEFVAECEEGHIVASNVLVKMIRIQQICSGFCFTKEDILDSGTIQELNTAKEDDLFDLLTDVGMDENVVVFCQFRHDLQAIKRATEKSKRTYYELSGTCNQLSEWKDDEGAVIGVQIQAGSEGVDMTKANHAIYFSVPHSLAMYNQSKARLYRPGQTRPVSFTHLVVKGTVDEIMYNSLMKKEDVIESVKQGSIDFSILKRR